MATENFDDLRDWIKYGNADNVSVAGNVLTVKTDGDEGDNVLQGVYSNFQLDSTKDFAIEVEIDVTGPSLNAWYADLHLNFRQQTGPPWSAGDPNWGTAVFCRRSYNSGNGGHVFQSIALEDEVAKTTDTDVNSATSGSFRMIKVGNTITCYYNTGSGWVMQGAYTFTNFNDENAHINLMLNMVNARAASVDFSVLVYSPPEWADYFNGVNGDPPSAAWAETDADNVLDIQGDKLEFDATAITVSQVVASIDAEFTLTGDFSIRVDYTLEQMTSPPSQHYAPIFRLLNLAKSVAFGSIARARSSSWSGGMWAQGTDQSTQLVTLSDAGGQLRLTRVSGVIKGYYNRGLGTGWEWNGNSAGLILDNGETADILVSFYWEQEIGTDVKGTIDNFEIETGTVGFPSDGDGFKAVMGNQGIHSRLFGGLILK